MATKILSFYLRVGTGAARVALSLTERALLGAGRVIGLAGRDEPPTAETEPPVAQTEPPVAQTEPSVAQTEPPAAQTEPPAALTERAARPTQPRPEPMTSEAEPVPDQTTVDYEAEPSTPLDPGEELTKTLDDQPDLVEELAEPGAEDGAGATVEIEEPWEGYAKLDAQAVITRLGEASAAELALVDLYERANKRRQTVLAAAGRRHREISGPAGL